MITELCKGNRSYRRFHQEAPVARETLVGLVNLARLSASAANLQPLKYILSCDPDKNAAIFSCLAWAGYLKDWPGPAAGSGPRPTSSSWGTRRSPKISAATTASRPNPSSWGPGTGPGGLHVGLHPTGPAAGVA